MTVWLRICDKAPPATRPDAWSSYGTTLIDKGDRFDLDHRVGVGEPADLDRRAGRGCGTEIAQPHVAVLGEFRVVCDVGVRLDDVAQAGAGGFEASLDVLADLLDLGAHIALADTNALRGTRQLAGDK